MKIGFYGDPHGGQVGSRQVHESVLSAIGGCDLILCLGDMAHHSTEDGWLEFEDVAASYLRPGKFFPVRGNHDHPVDFLNFFNSFIDPNGKDCYYYLDLGDMLIIFLEIVVSNEQLPCTNPSYPNQVTWLTNVLEDNEDKLFKIACYHTPPYTKGTKGPNLCARSVFQPVLESYGVDLVLCGHIHAYERYRVGGIDLITSGGAGGLLHALEDIPDIPGVENPIGISEFNYGIINVIKTNTVARLDIVVRNAITHEKIDSLLIDNSDNLEPTKQKEPSRFKDLL